MKKASVLLVAIALALFGLAACGDDDDDGGDGGDTTAAETTEATTGDAGGGGAGGTVDVAAPEDGSLAFEPAQLSASAGPVTINFDNPADLTHDVKIESPEGEDLGGTDQISGSTATATVDLEPGTYTYYCSVPGHREGGMEGTLTVK